MFWGALPTVSAASCAYMVDSQLHSWIWAALVLLLLFIVVLSAAQPYVKKSKTYLNNLEMLSINIITLLVGLGLFIKDRHGAKNDTKQHWTVSSKLEDVQTTSKEVARLRLLKQEKNKFKTIDRSKQSKQSKKFIGQSMVTPTPTRGARRGMTPMAANILTAAFVFCFAQVVSATVCGNVDGTQINGGAWCDCGSATCTSTPNVFKQDTSAGGWGGACTCPDGSTCKNKIYFAIFSIFFLYFCGECLALKLDL